MLLAEELEKACAIDTAFVVLNSHERCTLAYPIIHCAPAQLLESCLAHSGNQPAALLIHVSGYGYSVDGAPTLLAEALARVQADGRFSIGAYFHELFATGMPWKSAFWYTRRQQKAVRRIAELCNLVVTNTSYHANWLERETTRQSAVSIQLLPVFSTAGEIQSPIPVAQRQPVIAVFGLPESRRRAYTDLAALGDMSSLLGIKEILDIGAESDTPSQVNGIPVRRKGAQGVSELARELSLATYGFLPYAAMYLAKSSTFAAYCAQGAVPVIATPFAGEVDGLKDGVHLLSPKTASAARVCGLDHCSRAAWEWYSEHRIHVHAAAYARWLNQFAAQQEREQRTI
ncbi:MAG: hypothetical protein WB341_04875 [Terracidiphilus sp.]